MSDSSVDTKDQETWSRVAQQWWQLDGPMKPLHHMNPTRISFIVAQTREHFGKSLFSREKLSQYNAIYTEQLRRLESQNIDYTAHLESIPSGSLHPDVDAPLTGVSIVDVGCGAGILAEHLAYLGGCVLGLDTTAESIPVARAHAKAIGVALEYKHGTVSDLVQEKQQFDVDAIDSFKLTIAVCCLEVVEHVCDVNFFLDHLCKLVRPGGLLIMSTPNRTILSYLAVIIAAERILGWIPVGAHDWSRFMRPCELKAMLERRHLSCKHIKGLELDVLRWQWFISDRDWIDYFITCDKPKESVKEYT
eukprot:gene893-4156_t